MENSVLRTSIIQNFNYDIWSISETYLEGDQKIDIVNYEWIVHNRATMNIQAPKTFGGSGLLFKIALYDTYNVQVLDKSHDGILIVCFQDKQTYISFVISSCYFPPYWSIYANATNVFAHILSQIYLHQDADLIVMCGDLNGRIGKLPDATDIDNLPNRISLEDTVKGHGESQIEFLNDGRLYVLNGRFDPKQDNYTCIKGNLWFIVLLPFMIVFLNVLILKSLLVMML